MTEHQLDVRLMHVDESVAVTLPLASGMPVFVQNKDIMRMGNNGETVGGVIVGPFPQIHTTPFGSPSTGGSTVKKPILWVPTGWTLNLLAVVSSSSGGTFQFALKYGTDLSASGTAMTGNITSSTTTPTITSGGSILNAQAPAGNLIFHLWPSSQAVIEHLMVEMYFRWAPA